MRKVFTQLWLFSLVLVVSMLCCSFVWAQEEVAKDFSWSTILAQILVAVLIPAAAILGTLFGKLLKRGIAKIDNEALQQGAWVAVRFVEQKFKKMNNADKFAKVYTRLAKKLPGVKQEDLEHAVEAAVNSMKKESGNVASSPTE